MNNPIEIEPNVYIPATLVPFWEALKTSRLPLVRIETEVKSNLGLTKSKFAGKPYIPLNQPYPLDDNHKPMMLLAQLNFDQIPYLQGYPTTGLLQFFISATDSLYGADFENPINQGKFRVIYHQSADESTANLNVSVWEYDNQSTDYYPPISAEHELTFRTDSEFVSAYDARFKQFFGQDSHEFWQAYNDERIGEDFDELANPTGHKIGGYAYFTQADPRYFHYQDYILLLQIDSLGDHICWGDAGVGNFFIHPRDLAALDFSKVFYTWDCM